MKCIVTGALGHIGSALIRLLGDHFEKPLVIMIDDLSTQRYCSLFNLPKNSSYRFIEKKVQDVDWQNLLDGVDVVIHLAATTDAAGTADKPELVRNNNLTATRIIAEACLEAHIPLVFPSTTSVYGSQSLLVDETCTELLPQSPYALCKIEEEKLLQDFFQKGLQGVICRLGTIYGTSEGMRFHTAVNKFSWQAVMCQPVTVWETALHQKRPYLYLGDAVNAFVWIIKNKLYEGSLYNIVTGNHTVSEVLTHIRAEVSDLEVTYVQHRIMNQLSYEVSTQKFKETGFGYSGSLGYGIAQTVQLLKNAYGRVG